MSTMSKLTTLESQLHRDARHSAPVAPSFRHDKVRRYGIDQAVAIALGPDRRPDSTPIFRVGTLEKAFSESIHLHTLLE